MAVLLIATVLVRGPLVPTAALPQTEQELAAQYAAFQAAKLNLDLTRGKPSSAQLDLSNALDGILGGNYKALDGTDTRNYGGLDGLPELKQLYAQVMGAKPEEMLIGGSSSLTLMHQVMTFAHFLGFRKPEDAWAKDAAKFIAVVPGYDRHFAICEQLGIPMIPVRLKSDGPDMDEIERLVASDKSIKGIWCVPRFSNPTGHVYSKAVVERMAQLGRIAADNFLIMWDNAYALHSLDEDAPELPSILDACRQNGTENSVILFGSTSKISFAGAGVAFMAASKTNLDAFRKHLAIATIGPDKVNQLRHIKLLPDLDALKSQMRKQAQHIKPRFDLVLKHLREGLGGLGIAEWTEPKGGYFISLDTLPGLAKEVVKLAAGAGVKLTPAGATWPNGKDPEDRNIRIAPTVPTLDELDKAMQIFILCVKLATVRQKSA
jgi:DNA-binding transcriptional MocR family regulator